MQDSDNVFVLRSGYDAGRVLIRLHEVSKCRVCVCACVVTSDRDLGPGELEKVSLMVKAASEARPASESTTLI